MTARLEPAAYRRWFEMPLGRRVDADEKSVVFTLADLKRGEQILDVGCGDGSFTQAALERTGSAVGLDRSKEMLRAAKGRFGHLAGAVWVEGDAAALPFPDGTFDSVLAATVLCFAGEAQAIVNEAYRVLRPGGRLVLAELGRYSAWALVRRIRGLVGSGTWREAQFFAPRQLRGLLRQAGFTQLSSSAAVFYPPLQSLAGTSLAAAIERIGRRWCSWAGAMVVVRGQRP